MLAATALRIETWPQTAEAFRHLIEATQDELVQFAAWRLGNPTDAEDVVQEVYLQAFRDRVKHQAITAVRPYLFRMTGNRCTDLLRARQRQEGRPAAELACASEAGAIDRACDMARLLDRIPDAEAEVLRLRAWTGLSFAEIASAVGAPEATVKSRFRYGIDKLRRLMEEQGGGSQ